jgi:hypothetical protein
MKIPNKLPDEVTIPINRKTLFIFGLTIIVWSLLVVAVSEQFFQIKEITVYPDGTKEYRVQPK